MNNSDSSDSDFSENSEENLEDAILEEKDYLIEEDYINNEITSQEENKIDE